MDYDWIEDYCLSMLGVEKEYKLEWDAILYKVGGKFFAMVGNDKSGADIVSVKLPPEIGQQLRQRYAGVKPGYYLNKTHWNSAALDGTVPAEAIQAMLSQSYGLVFAGLTKKAQQAIKK